MAEKQEDSGDLEEDFASLVLENADKDLHIGSFGKTVQVGTDQVDASASATTDLVGIIPGTLSERIDRHKTFQKYGWSKINSFPKDYELSEAGFFYEGKGDEVTCQYCFLKLSQWEEDDNPFREHKEWSEDCPYIKQFPNL